MSKVIIELCPLLVVAVVQGVAIAGGKELVLHCDLVVASEKARFGILLAQVGLAPELVPGQEVDGSAGAGDNTGEAVVG